VDADAVQITDETWNRIAPLLPAVRRKNNKGRPRMSDRQAMTAILFRLRTGCSWKALPRGLGAASTVHDRFREWRGAGVFDQMRRSDLLGQDEFERV
jgi:transposase